MLPENSLHPRAKRKSNLQICCKYLEKKEDRVRSMKEGAPTEEALGGTSQQSGQASKILARQPDHPISGAVWQLPTHGQVGGQEPHRAQLSPIIPQEVLGLRGALPIAAGYSHISQSHHSLPDMAGTLTCVQTGWSPGFRRTWILHYTAGMELSTRVQLTSFVPNMSSPPWVMSLYADGWAP